MMGEATKWYNLVVVWRLKSYVVLVDLAVPVGYLTPYVEARKYGT
jgi:hypothetical protein